MEILTACLISAALMTASVLLHYQSMRVTRSALRDSKLPRRAGVLVGMAALTVSQLVSVSLYAVAYVGMHSSPSFGALAGEMQGTLLDHFYFSLMSYTTLGVGDIYPLGAVRIVSGIEALNGFALIGWTASFAYTLMREDW